MKRQWFLAVAIITFLAVPSFAHEAPSGFKYDQSCCSDQDCQQVSDEAVKETQGGYLVSIPEGVHNQAPDGITELVPYRLQDGSFNGSIRPSGDDHKHVCISPYSHKVLCIYVRPGGV